jgi:hypothetical protein
MNEKNQAPEGGQAVIWHNASLGDFTTRDPGDEPGWIEYRAALAAQNATTPPGGSQAAEPGGSQARVVAPAPAPAHHEAEYLAKWLDEHPRLASSGGVTWQRVPASDDDLYSKTAAELRRLAAVTAPAVKADNTAVMQQALEALEESIDLVRHEYTSDWRHGLETRRAQLTSMKAGVEAHEAAIVALRNALSSVSVHHTGGGE